MPSVHPPARLLVLACTALVGACSGGGSGGGDSSAGTGGAIGVGGRELTIVSSDPGDGAVQVPLDGSFTVGFDGPLADESLLLDGAGLFIAGDGRRIPTTTELGDGRREVRFTPVAPLPAETDLELRLPPLVHDVDGRVLDRDVVLRFRTLDSTPPRVIGWSYADGPHPIRVDEPLRVDFDEALDASSVTAATVALHDAGGRALPCDLEVAANQLVVRPVQDVPGDLELVLSVRGVADRSANRAAESWSRRARTPVDVTQPRLLEHWPATEDPVSPRAAVRLVFGETVRWTDGSIAWWNEDRMPIDFAIVGSRDGRTLFLVPREPLPIGAASFVRSIPGDGPADVSGNPLAEPLGLVMIAGADSRPPALVSTTPAKGATLVPAYVTPVLTFDEALEPRSVDLDTVRLLRADDTLVPLAAVLLEADGRAIRLVPDAPLEPGAALRIVLSDGLTGVCDSAGNPLAMALTIPFSVNPDAQTPHLRTWPANEAVAVALDTSVAIGADLPLDPASVTPDSVFLKDHDGHRVPGRLTVELEGRAIRFTPDRLLEPGIRHHLRVRGGPLGVRATNGNWLPADHSATFRSGYRRDDSPPHAAIVLEDIASARSGARCIARNGVAIAVRPAGGADPTFDATRVELVLEGGGRTISATEVTAVAELRDDALRFVPQAELALGEGRTVARATIVDLSGNRSAPVELVFDVAGTHPDVVPFERTQLVWVRFDLDRDGNGRADFDDDLVRLGLCTDADPIGTNAWLSALVRDGVLAQCHSLFGRERHGGPRDRDSIAVRLTAHEPRGLPHMQIACGGFDPEGPRDRTAGSPSTGTLGRAWFDYRNRDPNERNVAVAPGLGVFPAELWLFEVRVHGQVYPSFVTSFAKTFLPITPALGGTAVGEHPLDALALAASFDPATAPGAQRARRAIVLGAADEWATAVAIVLAHEVGHSIGLTATGDGSAGLHGDASLHNAGANTTDVMASAIGYEALVSLDFRFRDLNVAYLRHRVLLR